MAASSLSEGQTNGLFFRQLCRGGNACPLRGRAVMCDARATQRPGRGGLAAGLALCALWVLGTGNVTAADATAAHANAATEAAAQSARMAMRGALMPRELPLRVHATCKNGGASPDGQDGGRLPCRVFGRAAGANNGDQAGCQPLTGMAGAQRCDVWLKHRDTDDEWAWGLRFDMDAAGRQVRQGSVRCLGSG